MIEAAEELGKRVGLSEACRVLGVPRSSVYRARKPNPAFPRRPTPARALAAEERAEVRGVLNSARFWDWAPREVYATLLDEGKYLCHWRTMYRILAEYGEVYERRNQRRHPAPAKPELCATGPNQLWSWDISHLRGRRGVHYYLYVILDIFSRFVPGWMIAERELARLAEQLIAETCAKQGITREQLVLHSDRGSAMRSKTVAQLLIHLGVAKSHSRPYTPTDNPYSESQFKTMKYRPDYPQAFAGMEEARRWAQEFFGWYNHEHHHSALGLMTPAAVHYELADAVYERRRQVLGTAYSAHPERFVGGQPTPPRWPDEVWINPHKDGHGSAELLDAETRVSVSRVPTSTQRMPHQPSLQEILLPKLDRELSHNC